MFEPIILYTWVSSNQIDFELESGAGVLLLPYSNYGSINFMCNIPPTKVKLKMYNGLIIELFGEIYITIKYKSICHLIVIAVKSNCRPFW